MKYCADKRQLGKFIERANPYDVLVVSEVSRLTRNTLQVLEIRRDFISERTKEALAKRKANGMVLGRPKGRAKNLRLDPLADKIDMYREKKIDKRSIAKLMDVSPNILYVWLQVRRPVNLE